MAEVHETITRVLHDYDTGARLCARYRDRIQDIEQLQADCTYLARVLKEILVYNENARGHIDKLKAENEELEAKVANLEAKLTEAAHKMMDNAEH